jgi:hypothetical protein
VERKPASEAWESFAERKIRAAQQAGAIGRLPSVTPEEARETPERHDDRVGVTPADVDADLAAWQRTLRA